MKKAFILMFTLSLVLVVLSASTFAAGKLQPRAQVREHFQSYFHHNNFMQSLNLNNDQIVKVKESLQANKDKIKEVQDDLQATLKELKDLYAEKENGNPGSFNLLNDIDNKIDSLNKVVENYRNQLQFLRTEQANNIKNVLSTDQLKKLQNFTKNHQFAAGFKGKEELNKTWLKYRSNIDRWFSGK